MPVEMRGSLELNDDDELLVHMGAGSPDTVVATALRAFHDYEGVLPGLRGAFTVSVFGLVRGVTASEVLAEMPHKSFGVARFGDLRTGFDVWPTTITGTAVDPRVQAVHFDIVLAKDELVPPGHRVEDMEVVERDRVLADLRPTAANLLDLFAPRVGRYTGKDGAVPDHPKLEGRDLW